MLIKRIAVPLVALLCSIAFVSTASAQLVHHTQVKRATSYKRTADYKGMDYKATAASMALRAPRQYYAGIGGGLHLFSTPKDNFIPSDHISPPDLFHPKSWSKPFAVNLEGGVILPTSLHWMPTVDVGLEYIGGFNGKVKGNTTLTQDPKYLNYNYSEKVQTHALFLNTNLNFVTSYPIYPFVLAGIGAAYNRVSGYQETALPGVTHVRHSLAFGNNNKTNFAYQVGVGLAVKIVQGWELRLSGRYSDYGKVALGTGRRLGVKGPSIHIKGPTVILMLRKAFAL